MNAQFTFNKTVCDEDFGKERLTLLDKNIR